MSKEQFKTLYSVIERDGAKDLLSWLEKSDFFTAPASTRFHGNYEGGLCEHSIAVCKHLTGLCEYYGESARAESIAIVSLLHDLCKVNMYVSEKRNRKNERGQWEQYDAYGFNEKLAYGGHGSKSVFLIERFLKLTVEEAVAVNCHMASWDRLPSDYSVGAAFESNTLAWLLHVADEAATYIDKK